jgi:dTDP-4-dehydrorhamnose reductase
MTKSDVLVFGGSGQVGWELRHRISRLGQIGQVESPRVDFSDPDAIRKAVREVRPAFIVNAAAYTAVDKAEAEPELAAAINAIAPGILAEEARRFGSILIHYSTDYVFDGTKPAPYFETDAPNPLNVYGRTKLAGDQAIQSVGGDYLILRTSWVYGPRGTNFLLTMLRLAAERTELRIVDDQLGAPTSSASIARATLEILAPMLSSPQHGLRGLSGIYNLTNTGATTWFRFAKAIFTAQSAVSAAPIPNLVPIKTSEFPRPARRPANSRLSCQCLEETFDVRMQTWQDALSDVLQVLGKGSSEANGNV